MMEELPKETNKFKLVSKKRGMDTCNSLRIMLVGKALRNNDWQKKKQK